MNALLYGVIWLALTLFVAGELGKRRLPGAARERWAWMLGAVLCAAHMAIALATRHGWSQASARAEIARRTAEVYGTRWDGAIAINYLFGALWLAEAVWWCASPAGYARRPGWLVAALRLFYLVVIVNGALVFASPSGRILGVPLVAGLALAWWPRGASRRLESSGPRV